MSDPRCYPLIDLNQRQIGAMLAPILGGAEPLEVVRVEGGLVNTIYRVTIDGEEAAYALRVYAAGRPAFEIERRLLSNLRTGLPVPEVIFADASGLRCAYPYLVYRWLKGITLNEARKQLAPKLFLTLAEPLGRLLARIGSVSFPDDLFGEWHCGRSTIIGVAARLAQAEAQLCTDPARRRLGDALADRLRDHLATNAPLVRALDQPCGLVHGDFGGRNILVKADAGGEWSISGVLDWESAAAGSALWDVGSLFRYPGRYSTEFRGLFAHGYHAAGGALSHDWCWTSRLLDATQLVATLSEEQELPSVYAECRELIESVVCGNEQAAA